MSKIEKTTLSKNNISKYAWTKSLLCTKIFVSLIIRHIGIKTAVNIIKDNEMPSIPKLIVQNKSKVVKNWKLPFSALNFIEMYVTINKLIRVVYKPMYLDTTPPAPAGTNAINIIPNKGTRSKSGNS